MNGGLGSSVSSFVDSYAAAGAGFALWGSMAYLTEFLHPTAGPKLVFCLLMAGLGARLHYVGDKNVGDKTEKTWSDRAIKFGKIACIPIAIAALSALVEWEMQGQGSHRKLHHSQHAEKPD